MNANEKPAIGVIGVGWVGLVTAGCFAQLGHPVFAVDVDERKVDALRSGGELPIHEPGLPELIERNRGRLRFTTEIGDVLDAARLLFCCVDTPPTYSGDADLSRVESVIASLMGAPRVLLTQSCTAALEIAALLTLKQVDPLIRQLTLYRDLIDRTTGDPT